VLYQLAATTIGNPWIAICNNKATAVYFVCHIKPIFVLSICCELFSDSTLVQSLKFMSIFRFYLMYFHPLKVRALFSLD
jgi:hypothetical protein